MKTIVSVLVFGAILWFSNQAGVEKLQKDLDNAGLHLARTTFSLTGLLR